MAYRAMVLQLLISCPGDVEAADRAAIRHAITRWNVLHGESQEHVVIPVYWSDDAAAEFGRPPQEIINEQHTDVVDMGIAIFWGRLGQETETAESGTDEEIKRLHDAGKPVSVLRCTRAVPPSGDHEQRRRLDEYMRETMWRQGVVIEYDDPGALERQVDTILTRMVRKHERDAQYVAPQGGRRGGSHVVADITRESTVDYSSKGKPKNKTRRRLRFRNTGGSEARNIAWKLVSASGDENQLPVIGNSGDQLIPVLAANDGEIDYPMIVTSGAGQLVCHIDWLDNGNERHNETTLNP